MPPTTRRMSRSSLPSLSSIHSPTSTSHPSIPNISESMQNVQTPNPQPARRESLQSAQSQGSTGTPPTPDRPLGIDTPQLQMDMDDGDGDGDRDGEAIHEDIVQHVTAALHREDDDDGDWAEDGEEEEDEDEGYEDEDEDEDGNRYNHDSHDKEIESGGEVMRELYGDKGLMKEGGLDAGENGEKYSGSEGEGSEGGKRKGKDDEDEDDNDDDLLAEIEAELEDEDEQHDTAAIRREERAERRERAIQATIFKDRASIRNTMPRPPQPLTAPGGPNKSIDGLIHDEREREGEEDKREVARKVPEYGDLATGFSDEYEDRKPVQYLCASGDCDHISELRRGDRVKCRGCGCYMLWKTRTKTMVQFEAR